MTTSRQLLLAGMFVVLCACPVLAQSVAEERLGLAAALDRFYDAFVRLELGVWVAGPAAGGGTRVRIDVPL